MKKLFFSAWVCMALACACRQVPGYKLTGTIQGAQDGDTVKMFVFEDWNEVVLQKTVVKDGAFTFTGRQDTAAFRYITCIKNGTPLATVELVLENGEIRIAMAAQSYYYDIKGTPANEKWCTFHNENERLCGESLDLYRSTQDSTLTDEVKAQKKMELEAKEKEIAAFRLQFCRDNIENIAGANTLAMYHKDFDAEEVAKLVALILDCCNTKEVAALKEEIANKQKTAIGQPFTDFTMKTPEGKELSVDDIAEKAKVTMIDFWASWCGPCRAEMPYVKAAYEKYHDKGFEIVGVSLDNSADAWKKAITDLELPWPQISDLKGWECEGAVLYGVKAIPATILIQDGKIIARDLREEAVVEKLSEILE